MARTIHPRSAGKALTVGALLVSLMHSSVVPMSSVTYRQESRLARAALAALPGKPVGVVTGYRRALFGPAWADIDHDGCDQRNEVLSRDLNEVRYRDGSRCVVAAGVLHDPYTGASIDFVRGPKTSTRVQIDHVVSLADAWRTGAQQLDQNTRAHLAGDLLELVAVDGPTNEAKGDRDAAGWLPPNRAYRCRYVARQIKIKQKYRLWVTPAERAAMAGVLATCPKQPLPADSDGGTS